MNIIETKTLSRQQKMAIVRLWNQEYPHQLKFDTVEALDDYLWPLNNPVHYFVLDEHDRIIAWTFLFERDMEMWFAIIVDTTTQQKGLGTSLLDMLKENQTLLNGWLTDHNNYFKTDGTTYLSPLGFYLKNGFTLCKETMLETGKLSAVKIKWVKEPGQKL